MANRRIIAIAGGSGSGKTTLAKHLVSAFGADNSILLSLDDYYRDQAQLSFEDRLLINYDHPNSFEIDLLSEHLASLKENCAIQYPEYDFALHTRKSATRSLFPKPYIVVEGILALHFEEIRNVATDTIFVDAPVELRFSRRMMRDTLERSRTPQSIEEQWKLAAQPMYCLFCEPSKKFADLIIRGEGSYQEVLREFVK